MTTAKHALQITNAKAATAMTLAFVQSNPKPTERHALSMPTA